MVVDWICMQNVFFFKGSNEINIERKRKRGSLKQISYEGNKIMIRYEYRLRDGYNID